MNKPVAREGFVADEPAAVNKIAAIPDATSAPPPAEEETNVWPIRVRLVHRAIKDNTGNEIRELSFREPSGSDIVRYGNPVSITTDGEAVINERKMTLMMGALSGVLSPLIEKMDPRDWNSCAYRLRGFFLPEPYLAW